MGPYQKNVDKVVAVIKKLIGPEPSLIMEMGACDCTETLAFSHFFPKTKIIAFECNPDTLPICRERVKGNKNISLIEKAVSDKEGIISFYKVTGAENDKEAVNRGASSIFEINRDLDLKDLRQEKVEVPATTIQKVCEERNLEKIDLLWMDMQGAELSALKGAGECLKRVKIINIEVEFFEQYKGEPVFKDIRKFLNEHGFRLYAFSSIWRTAGDAVFINADLVKKPLLPQWLIFFYYRAYEKITEKPED